MARAGEEIGPYTLVSKLGSGSFGAVWLAERRTSLVTTNVALKIPLEDDVDLAAIKQEAALWAQASGHPNVLPIIDANVYGEKVVIASEYAPDGSLDAWLRANGGAAPSAEVAIEIASGILLGLEHLHARHVIHRDLKPGNILLQGRTPRLADFGISRLLKSTSASSIVAGTPSYMAPEAFDGKRSEQTDIWSVGVILYQMLSGRLPFPQTDITSLLGAIVTRNPDPLPISTPADLKFIIDKMLAKSPANRYRCAADALADLKRVRADNMARDPHATLPYESPTTSEPATERSADNQTQVATRDSNTVAERQAVATNAIAPDRATPNVVPRSAGSSKAIGFLIGLVALLVVAVVAVGVMLTVRRAGRRASAAVQHTPNNVVVGGRFPEGSTRLLTDADLAGKSQWDLRLMRNEIFARHGYIFDTPEMRDYFTKQPWYKPQYSDVTGMLSPLEKDNVAFIKRHER